MELIDKSIVICALARDCASSLISNIPRIERLREFFNRSAVVVIENDSIDSTKDVLNNWQHNSRDVTVLSTNTSSVTIPPKASPDSFPGMSLYRIEKMAGYRNKYLNWLEAHGQDFDLMLLIDADVQSFSVEGVIDALKNAPKNFGGLFANGYTDTKVGEISLYSMHHDMFAFLDTIPHSKPYLTVSKLFSNKKEMNSRLSEVKFLPVISAFGGIGIYKVAAIQGLKYVAEPNEDKYMEAVCEHIPFNIEINRRGYNNYICRDIKVYYGASDPKIVLRNLLPLWLFKAICLVFTFKRLKG